MSSLEEYRVPITAGQQLAKEHLAILCVVRTAPIGQLVRRLRRSLFVV